MTNICQTSCDRAKYVCRSKECPSFTCWLCFLSEWRSFWNWPSLLVWIRALSGGELFLLFLSFSPIFFLQRFFPRLSWQEMLSRKKGEIALLLHCYQLNTLLLLQFHYVKMEPRGGSMGRIDAYIYLIHYSNRQTGWQHGRAKLGGWHILA